MIFSVDAIWNAIFRYIYTKDPDPSVAWKLCRRFLSFSSSRIFHSYIKEIKEIHSFSANSSSLSDIRCLLIVLRDHVHVVLCSTCLLFDILHFVRLPGTFPSPSFVRLTDRWPRTIDRYKFVCNQLANRMEKGRDLSSCAGSTRVSYGVSIRYIRQMNALCARGRVEYWSRKYRDRSRVRESFDLLSPHVHKTYPFPTSLPRRYSVAYFIDAKRYYVTNMVMLLDALLPGPRLLRATS